MLGKFPAVAELLPAAGKALDSGVTSLPEKRPRHRVRGMTQTRLDPTAILRGTALPGALAELGSCSVRRLL